ncbi:MAG TPA: PadR family transcriptional regulator, partial [Patescibacteria group bacterium]|nr:PadR family transcriptional regulator [Patescibacteria group bacterium]
ENVAPEISPLALSILELLDEQPMHPYQLASTMRGRHHDEFIRLNFGSLYHTVDALEKSGWIVPVEREKEGRRPERTVYQLTDSGRELLVGVVGDLLARPKREFPHFAAGLMFMHHLRKQDAAEHLRVRAAALKAHIEKLSGIMGELQSSGVSRLSLVELAHKIAMLEAERRWVGQLEHEITSGKLEWKVGNVGIESSIERLRSRHGKGSH